MQAKRTIADIVDARWSFSAEDAADIIATVGIPPALIHDDFPDHFAGSDAPIAEVLAWHLNNAAVQLRWDERRQTMPSPADVKRKASRIADLCNQLRAEMTDPAGQVLDGLGAGALFAFAALEDGDQGKQAVENVVREIARLQGWADQLTARKRLEAKDAPPKRGRKRDTAWHRLVDRLSGVYFHVWKQRPGLSRDAFDATPGGPYFRFVEAVAVKLLPGTKTSEAIATALSQHRWPQWDKLG